MIKRLATSLLLAALLSLLVGAALAFGAEKSLLRIRQANLARDGQVTLTVSVAGEGTDRVLDAGSFRVTEQGSPIEITGFHPLVSSQVQKVAVALVLDISGSTKGKPLEDAKAAAKAFVQRLPPQVVVAVVAFESSASLRQDFTADHSALINTIDALQAAGETALYDGVALASATLAKLPEHQHNIVVFSDGKDTVARTSLEQAIDAAKSIASPVTAVGLVTADFDGAALESLAAGTGGKSVPVEGSQQLAETFDRVAKEIASQYVITYRATRLEPKELEIQVTLQIGSSAATDEIAAINPRVAPVKEGDRRPEVAAPQAPALAPIGLFLGGAAFFIALVLLLVSQLKPRQPATLNLLRRSQAGSKSENAEKGPFATAKLASSAVSFMEHLPKPQGFEEKIQLLLDRAAWPLRAAEFLVLQALGLVGGLMVGFGLFGRASLAILLAVAGAFLPRTVLRQRVEKRERAFMTQLPDTLQLLAGSLQAGHGLLQAIDTAAKEVGPPASQEFARVLMSTRLGIPFEDALDDMASRVGSEDFRWVVMAINIQRQVGGNLAVLLDTVAGTLREREQLRRQVKVLSAEGRLSAWVLGALPFFLFAYMALVNQSYISALLITGMGRVMIVGALAVMGLGMFWMRKIVRIEV